MMRIYLDNCCLQRPLDDQTHPRIKVETEAVFAILAAVQAGEQVLLGSEALEYEVMRIPDEARRSEVLSVLALAAERLQITDAVAQFRAGNGDYTAERKTLFKDESVKSIVTNIKALRSAESGKPA